MSKPEGRPLLKPGREVTIKVEGAKKVRAVVRGIQAETEVIDVTYGGSSDPYGPPPDRFRRSVPGMTTTTIMLELLP